MFAIQSKRAYQGIKNCKRTETFAKEPKLAKLLRGLSRRSRRTTRKLHWFFSHVCNCKFAAFWVLFCGVTCKWVLFPIIDLYFYQVAQIVGYYTIESFPRAQSRLQQKLNVYVFQPAKNCTLVGLPRFLSSFCLRAPQLIRLI